MAVVRVFGFRSVFILASLFLLAYSFASAQQSAAAPSKPEPAMDVTSMDRSVDPCVDFFKYSCGGWIKNNPIPPDQSSWSTYSKMQDENRV
ncbi:MAG: M13 family peptidase, partial [Candidatus Sulfotelmatobacter sp.]